MTITDRAPTESLFGQSFVTYLSGDANPHTSYIGANLKFIEDHPEQKLALKPYQGLGVLTLFSYQRRYVTRAIGQFSFGMAIYATDKVSARMLRENVVEAIGQWEPGSLSMDGQKVELLQVTNQIGPVYDKTGLQVAEISFFARLGSLS